MRDLLVVLVLVVACLAPAVHSIVNMYENEPEIDVLDKTTFDSAVYGSDKATFVEFYAHWCGACKRYKPLIIEIAKTTKTWHSNVLRVSVINCGDSFNDELCRKHNIGHYPTIKLFPAYATYNEKDTDRGAISLQLDSADNIVSKMIDLVETQQQNKDKKAPLSWPDLTPFTSKRFDTLFIPNKEVKFAILIFEKDDSYLGRKIILDFSAYSEKVIIRRTTPMQNPSVTIKLDVNPRKLPAVYIVNNTKSSQVPVNTVPAEQLTEALIKRYRETISVDFESDDDEAETDMHDEERMRIGHLIRAFIKINSLLTPDEANKIAQHLKAANEHREKIKKEEGQAYLENIKDKVYMQDLESGLHLMIRSDIAHSKLISGKKLAALREWITILANYFPGRKPVRNYLKNLNLKLSSPQLTEITGNQWKMIADENSTNSFLPEVVQWKHCLGSKEEFRGYPCSLWTIFHVLSVNQIEMEKAKNTQFENFNAKELVEGIRAFVINFFTCTECAENFDRETQDYPKSLKKPHDTILYLWQVHNRVNRRLANDAITEVDPKFPKMLFPSQAQCAKCYLPSVKNIDELSDHESPWNQPECLLFLMSYYSRYQIVPIDLQPKEVAANEEAVQEAQQVDEPQVPDAVIDRMPAEDAIENENGGGKVNPRVMAIGIFEKNALVLEPIDSEKSSDSSLFFIFALGSFATFGVIYVYFNFFRRSGGKSKKHII